MHNNLALFGSPFFKKTGVQVLTLAVVCFCAFFINLGAHDVDLMEARNFVTAREMVEKGNWLIPTMNGEIRLAKPPLPTWITALVRIAGGNADNNFILRLPAAMAATLMVYSFYGFMQTLSKDRLLALIAALVLATSLLVMDMGRRGSWDIYCHSFMMLAIWIFAHGWSKKESSFGAFITAGVALALSFMSKGPVSFYALLLPCVIAYALVFDVRRCPEKWRELVITLLIFGVISSAWPLLVHITYPDLSQAVGRTEVASWATKHVRPFYFYAHFPIYTGIWTVIIVAGFIQSYSKKRINNFGNYYFNLLWLALIILFLSVFPEKKERYLLPAMIPMAMMAGYLLRSLFESYKDGVATRGDNRLVAAHTSLACMTCIGMPFVLFYFGVARYLKTPASGMAWSVLFILLAGLIFYAGKVKKIGWLIIYTISLICLINISLLPIIYLSPLYRKNSAYQSLRNTRHIQELNGLDFYSLDPVSIPQIWDIGKTVKLLPNTQKSFLYERLPIALFSATDPTTLKNTLQPDAFDIQILGAYKADPKNAKRVKYVSIIKRAGSTKD